MANLHRAACHATVAAILITALLSAQKGQPAVPLTFGVYTTDKPSVMYRKFLPLVELMQDSMKTKLDCEVAIDFRIFKTYSEARTALVKGEIDFVRFGPASYVLAKNANPNIRLLAMETIRGKKLFKGYIVVRTDCKIRNLTQLRGKRFAFGDRTSTIGRYLAQKALLDVGIHAKDLQHSQYLGRHDKVFTAVQLRDFDAGALKSSTFSKMNKRGELRILARFDNVTKPWVCRAGLDPQLRSAMTWALLNIKDKASLRTLKADSFVRATDRDYDVIRSSMRAAEKFSPQSRPPARPRPGRSNLPTARPPKD